MFWTICRKLFRQTSQPTPSHRRRSSRSARRVHLQVEGLEERALLSAGDLLSSSLAAFQSTGVQSGPITRIGEALATAYDDYSHGRALSASLLKNGDGSRVRIEAVAAGDGATLAADLTALGGTVSGTFGRSVSASVPVSALDDLAGLASLRLAEPAVAPLANAGSVTDQADAALHTDALRALLGVDGTGLKIGVISDSFDQSGNGSYALDTITGDLPAGIQVLDDSYVGPNPAPTDEGRAMLQLVHDIAPGAALAFRTGFNGETDMAAGILQLAAAGCDIIVDDLQYFDEPMFQDGPIAQAVDQVVAQGVHYFSSASNSGRKAFEDTFRAGDHFNAFAFPAAVSGMTFLGGTAHDFDPGPGVDDFQDFVLGAGKTITLSFQWDSPSVKAGGLGCPNDMDLYILNGNNKVVARGVVSNEDNGGGNASELVSFTNTSANPGAFKVLIVNTVGTGGKILPTPGFFKYVNFGSTMSSLQFDTKSGTVFGHNNALGAIAVGAAEYKNTPAFSGLDPVIEDFSSAGFTDVLFDTAGNPSFSQRDRLRVVAPDGTNTSFFGSDSDGDGLPNFFGTSAAAPHAAAVAALLLSIDPTLTTDQLSSLLEATAIDMDDPSTPLFDVDYDTGTGFGLIQAEAAGLATNGPGTPELFLELNPFGDATLPTNFSAATDFDSYQFFTDTAGPVTVSVTGAAASDDPGFLLWDLLGGALQGFNYFANPGSDLPSLTLPLAVNNLYQVDVFNELASTGAYTLKVNGPTPAITPLTLNAQGTAVTTGSVNGSDADYFSFVVPAGATFLTATLTSATVNGVVTLYNAAGTQLVRQNLTGNGGTETLTFNGLTPGQTFHLRVGSAAFATAGNYSLTVSATPAGFAAKAGAAANDEARAVATDAAGNSYVTGFGGGVNGNVFVTKYNPAGGVVWTRNIGAAGDDRGLGVAVDTSGNVYVTGYFSGTVDFDPGAGVQNRTSAGGHDVFVLRLNSSGNFDWADRIGAAGADEAHGLALDGAGNAYVTGLFTGTVDFDPGAGTSNLVDHGGGDAFVLKLSNAGAFVWAKGYGSTAAGDVGNGITFSAGLVLVTGSFKGTVNFNPGGAAVNLASVASSIDAFVLKLNANGILTWVKQLGGAGTDVGNAIAVAADGSVYSTGTFTGANADFNPGAANFLLSSLGGTDVYVSKLDSAGTFVWAAAVGGAGADAGQGLFVASDGSVFLTGSFTGTVDFNPGAGVTNLTSAGGTDAFVLHLTAAGALVSATKHGGTGADGGWAVARGTGKDFRMVGFFSGSVTINTGGGTFSLTSAGGTDVLVTKLIQA